MSRRRKIASALLASVLTGVVAVEVAPSPVQAAPLDGAWSAVGNGMPDGTVFQIVTDADGSIYAAGTFTSAAGVTNTRNVAKWNGTAWTAVGTGVTAAGPNGASGGLYALALDPGANAADTSDDVIYVGGEIAGVGGVAVNRAAKWNGTAWSALGNAGPNNGFNNTSQTWDGVEEIVVVSSTAVYFGGNFDHAINTSGAAISNTTGIAKWDGSALGAVGTGLGGPANSVIVNGMTKDASGNVIATGQFTSAGGTGALRTAKWDPAANNNVGAWSNFGGTTSGPSATTAAVATSGSDVFVGGLFASVANTGNAVANTNFIAMWDDSASTWVSIGTVAGTVVEELRVIGNYLYAGGAFTSIGGVNANNIARMDLTAQTPVWEPLVSGCFNGVLGAVRSIIDAGNGSIYVAGGFTDAGGVTAADRIAKFTPGAATGCGGGGFVQLDSPSKFYLTNIEWGAKVGGKNGLYATVSWTAPTGANAPSFYKVTVDKATDQRTDGSFSNITPYPELDCWSFENSCRIFLAYSTQGGFGVTEARFTLYGYSFNGVTTPLVLDPAGPYTPVFAPGAPTNVKVVNGWKTVTVSWTTPADTGTYPITNYLVQASPGGNNCITRLSDPDLNSCTYTKLKPGTNYTFTVQALNGAGWGDKSEATATGISPQNIQITKNSRNRIRFLFFNRGSDVVVQGFAPGYPAGTSLTGWVKYGSSTQWQSIGEVKISAFGTFSWKRRFPTRDDRTAISVTFTQGNYQGNEVTMGAVR